MACRLARARIELQLKAQLDVVSERTALVIIEGVVEYGEDSLRGNRVGRALASTARSTYEKAGTSSSLGAPEAEQREGLGPVCV